MSKPRPARYRTTNGSACNAALGKRGSLPVWLHRGMTWHAPRERRPGRPPDPVPPVDQGSVELPLRQTAGMDAGLLRLADYAYLIESGKLVFEGRSEDFDKNPYIKTAYLGL